MWRRRRGGGGGDGAGAEQEPGHRRRLDAEASGLKVNYSKTSATLIRGSQEDEERTTQTLGCELARFPIRYLGLQLALRPLTKAEWQPMLDRVIKCVP